VTVPLKKGREGYVYEEASVGRKGNIDGKKRESAV
jgi:hypothetical protein